jgi:hypothetical protein
MREADVGGESAKAKARRAEKEQEERVPTVLPDGTIVLSGRSEAEARWQEIRLSLVACGAIEPNPRVTPGRWRAKPASPAQVETLGRMLRWTPKLPEQYREPARALAKHPGLTAGAASDLISILGAAVAQTQGVRHRTLQIPMEFSA